MGQVSVVVSGGQLMAFMPSKVGGTATKRKDNAPAFATSTITGLYHHLSRMQDAAESFSTLPYLWDIQTAIKCDIANPEIRLGLN